MLLELNVKDIALVKKASVSFEPVLNILTGETGTGKSVIIDSALLALGGRARGDMIRRGAEQAYAELIFDADREHLERLSELGIVPDENGLIVISRRLSPGRSISRINDETVSSARLKEAAALLLDVYGQNEYHTLLDKRTHLRILDEYIGEDAAVLKRRTEEAYRAFRFSKEKAEGFDLDEKERKRQADLLGYEIEEIDRAALSEGEEEELAARFRRLSNAREILDRLNGAHRALSGCDTGRAISEIESAMRFDESLKDIRDELMDMQSILDSCLKDISGYVSGSEVDERAVSETESRLELIRKLELKYGDSIEAVLAYREDAEKRLKSLLGYEEEKLRAEKELKQVQEELDSACAALSCIRKEFAGKLCGEICRELGDLGFEKPELLLSFGTKAAFSDGYDEVCFMTALNPGELPKPLSEVASGGELSRVMLAIKTVLAQTDDMPTLIFDEIDTGISGRTAQKVAEKLDVIGMRHQVRCVSHLPQIAAMADCHFVIRKTEQDGRNVTEIEKLDENGAKSELARLLGGAEITKAVSDNASEMLKLAKSGKKKRRKA